MPLQQKGIIQKKKKCKNVEFVIETIKQFEGDLGWKSAYFLGSFEVKSEKRDFCSGFHCDRIALNKSHKSIDRWLIFYDELIVFLVIKCFSILRTERHETNRRGETE